MTVKMGRLRYICNYFHSVLRLIRFASSFSLVFLLFLFLFTSPHTQVAEAQVEITEYSYDQGTNGVGRLSSVVEKKGSTVTGSTTYSYDVRGNVTTTDRLFPGSPSDIHYSIQSTYDSLNRLIDLTYPDGEVVHNAYDNQGLLDSVRSLTLTTNSNYVSTLDYNVLGQVTSKALGNGKTTTYSYDSKNFRLTGLSTTGLQDLSYGYDQVGNVTNITDSVGPGTQNFGYDALNRLSSAYSAASPPFIYGYGYTSTGTLPSVITVETIETLPSSAISGVDDRVEIALDQNGNPHLVYLGFDYSINKEFIRYAQRVNGVWLTETVPSPCAIGSGVLPSLALDSSGNPHITFVSFNTTGCASSAAAMIYATKSGGAWTSEVIRVWSPRDNAYLDDASRWSGTIAVDGAGVPHVAWGCSVGTCYAKRVNGAWVGTNPMAYGTLPSFGTWITDPRFVDNDIIVSNGTRIRLDAAGNPHIAAYNDYNSYDRITYAKWVGVGPLNASGFSDTNPYGWAKETVVSQAGLTVFQGQMIPFRLDNTGTPHLFYSQTNAQSVSYLYASKSGSSWVTESIPTAPYALSLDPVGNPHTSVIDSSYSHWQYGRRVGSDWVVHDITQDSVNYFHVSDSSSIEVDAGGDPHMAAYARADNDPTGQIRIVYVKIVPLQTAIFPAPGSPQPHAPVSDGTSTYSYDANGNILTKTTGGVARTYTWDFQNRLTQVTESGATLATFTYDYTGHRTSKIKPLSSQTNQITQYVGDLYECIINTSTPCTKYIFANGERVASRPVGSDDVHYYLQDHLSSTNVVTDSAGTTLQTLYYYPYGQTRVNSIAPSSGVSNKFTDQRSDDETGLYYYGARYYDPSIMLFISPDSIMVSRYNPQTLNRYSYALNNPLRYIDPSGHQVTDPDGIPILPVVDVPGTPIEDSPPPVESSMTMTFDPVWFSIPTFPTFSDIALRFTERYLPAVADIALAPLVIAGGLVLATPGTISQDSYIPTIHFEGDSGSQKIKDFLFPGGEPIGKEGSQSWIRRVPGDLSDAQKTFDELSKGGQQITKPGYPGTIVQFPDGTTIGFRPISGKGNQEPTIDFNLPDIGNIKVKFTN